MKTKTRLTGILIMLATSILIPTNSLGQNDWGVGVRLGDPGGITIKKYMAENAFELSIGRTHWWSGDKWYNDRFNDWYYEQKFGYKDFQYLGQKVSVPIGVQFHYLIHKEISEVGDENITGLDWYFGFGGQLRYQRYTYDYRYKINGSPLWYYETGDRVTDIDIGVDGVIGLEYTFEEVPISLFLDATLFVELIDNPFLFWMQGGIGARYNF